MKKLFTIILSVAVIASLGTLQSCRFNCKQGSGHIITETRNVSGFSQLDISGSYRVVITQDSVEKVSISADDNLIKYIQTDVIGDKLKIKSTHSSCASGQFVINIGLKTLTALETAGAITVTSTGKVTVKDLDIHTAGATTLNLDINANNINTEASGLTNITLKGQAASHSFESSGSANLNALDLVVSKYHIETSGLSHCKINVLNDLDVNSSGASDIQYRGNPANIHNNKSGIGSLQQVN